MHELLSVHSAEELDCIRKAGKLCEDAMHAMAARAKTRRHRIRAARRGRRAPSSTAAATSTSCIIGSTPMANPRMVFGNPRPSGRELAKGDIINMELAAGYRGYSAQIGSPICLGPPTDMVRRFWDEIALPGFKRMVGGDQARAIRSRTMRTAGRFFRQKGVQSRPIHAHGIDLVTDGPHVFTDHVDAEPFEQAFQPGMVFMAEPTPITADGIFGIFLGHTFIVTPTGTNASTASPGSWWWSDRRNCCAAGCPTNRDMGIPCDFWKRRVTPPAFLKALARRENAKSRGSLTQRKCEYRADG